MNSEIIGTKFPPIEVDMLVNYAIMRRQFDFKTEKFFLIYYAPNILSKESKQDIQFIKTLLQDDKKIKSWCRIIITTAASMISCEVLNKQYKLGKHKAITLASDKEFAIGRYFGFMTRKQ